MNSDDIIKTLLHKKTMPEHKQRFLNTGSTRLNIAICGKPNGGFPLGKFVLFVGDSESGKTFVVMSCLAEASLLKRFSEHRFIFDDPEDGSMMDKAAFFGAEVERRIEPPSGTRDNPKYSSTVEELYYHLDDAVNDGRPFIYILDSENALTSKAALARFKKNKAAHSKEAEEAGSFGDGKAIIHSANLRVLRKRLAGTNNLVIYISQTRANIGFGAQFEPKTRAGGFSLKFFADVELWSSVKKNLTKTVKKKPRQIGILAQIKIKKNRVLGKKSTVEFPIYHSHGIDDVGSMVQYLREEEHWGGKTGVIAPEFDFKGTEEQLIRKIETEGKEQELKDLVTEVWDDIQAASVIHRKKKYK